jgi:hypothetical protein
LKNEAGKRIYNMLYEVKDETQADIIFLFMELKRRK